MKLKLTFNTFTFACVFVKMSRVNVEGTKKMVACLVGRTEQRVSQGERRLFSEHFLRFLSVEPVNVLPTLNFKIMKRFKTLAYTTDFSR